MFYLTAIDQSVQGQGIGPALLRDAVLRTLQAAEIAGIRAILVHAISERAKRFYEKWGFISSPIEPLTLMITVPEARKAVTENLSEKAFLNRRMPMLIDRAI